MSEINPATPPAPAAPAPPVVRAATVTPRVDVLETEQEFLVLADVPGVKPEEVEIRFEQGEMTLHGRRPAGGHDESPVDYHRTFAVADTVAADKITAELKDGVLMVRLPKTEAVKPKRITVRG